MTDKPFGVNLTFLPAVTPPDYPGYIKAIIDGGVKIVETAGNNPQKWLPALKEAGIKVIHKCTSVRHSLKAEVDRLRRGQRRRLRVRRPSGRGRRAATSSCCRARRRS